MVVLARETHPPDHLRNRRADPFSAASGTPLQCIKSKYNLRPLAHRRCEDLAADPKRQRAALGQVDELNTLASSTPVLPPSLSRPQPAYIEFLAHPLPVDSSQPFPPLDYNRLEVAMEEQCQLHGRAAANTFRQAIRKEHHEAERRHKSTIRHLQATRTVSSETHAGDALRVTTTAWSGRSAGYMEVSTSARVLLESGCRFVGAPASVSLSLFSAADAH